MPAPIKIAVFAGLGAFMLASALSSNPGTAPQSAIPGGPSPGLLSGLRLNVGTSSPSAQGTNLRPQNPAQFPNSQGSAPQAPFGTAGYGAMMIPRERDGHYHVAAEINGRTIPMLVDTGATSIALSYEDAAAAGILPMPADFKVPMQTANGTGFAAAVRLQEVRVGQIVVRDVQGVVVPRGALSGSLLGMSFLGKLKGFEVAADNLVLKP